jgi:hypothetical protein
VVGIAVPTAGLADEEHLVPDGDRLTRRTFEEEPLAVPTPENAPLLAAIEAEVHPPAIRVLEKSEASFVHDLDRPAFHVYLLSKNFHR